MIGLTRRDALAAGLALPACRVVGQPMPDRALRTAARSRGRVFGAAVQVEQLHRDPSFRAAVLTQCEVLTPELALKWAAIQPQEAGSNGASAEALVGFAPMDALAAFARAHGRRIHGHTLVWHRSIPDWAKAAMAGGRWEVVHRYFAAVIGRYGDVIDRWDVVNEPVEPMDDADGLRRSPFLDAFGPDYIRRALDSARALAPQAQLLINEYGVEYPIAEEEARRKRLLRLVDVLKSAGTPLDGVGIQAHLRLDRGVVDQALFAKFLQDLADRDMAIYVTELDVREAAFDKPMAQRDQAVADAIRAFVDVALDQPAVRGIATWGLSDRYSWLNEDGEAGTRHRGGNRGLPLDGELQPKPFFDSLADAFASARPATQASVRPLPIFAQLNKRSASRPVGRSARTDPAFGL